MWKNTSGVVYSIYAFSTCLTTEIVQKEMQLTTVHYKYGGSSPTVSKLCAIGITPVVETSPWEGRNPKIPQYDAGTLTLPPVSVPETNRIFA